MSTEPIAKRLQRVRTYMQNTGLQALIVPSSDCHFSEYVADRYKCREYLSGFSGSTGTLVITINEAALWTDSRYFLQAEQQLQGSGILLMRDGLESTPSLSGWLADRLPAGSRIGLDGDLFSVESIAALQSGMNGLEIVPQKDFMTEIWPQRPPLSSAKVFFLSDEITGLSSGKKLCKVRQALQIRQGDVYLLSVLDQIAWLFNLRGTDIDYNMVAFCYAAVFHDRALLFIDPQKLTRTEIEDLSHNDIEVIPYAGFEPYLERLAACRILYNPAQFSYNHYAKLMELGCSLVRERDKFGIVNSLKGIKNDTEIEGFRKAMIEDGIALTRFYRWLEGLLKRGAVSSEKQISDMLHHFRSQSELFIRESFESIVGFRQNGAIVHYAVTDQSSITVDGSGFLLIDSGAHYRCGTTDITRTVHLGTPSETEKIDFTLVLAGHIDLASARFPAGTCGTQLDILARRPLLDRGWNYLHGTGHGVGHCLNVHEGPFAVRKDYNPVALQPGMVLSNEPGIYRPGRWGIRTENMMRVKEGGETEFGKMLEFETLSLCFIDTRSICPELLTEKQKEFLNHYHSEVYRKLSPHLLPEEALYLAEKCRAI